MSPKSKTAKNESANIALESATTCSRLNPTDASLPGGRRQKILLSARREHKAQRRDEGGKFNLGKKEPMYKDTAGVIPEDRVEKQNNTLLQCPVGTCCVFCGQHHLR
jgi:hypothetical protein